MTDTKPQLTAREREEVLRAEIALGIRKAEPIAQRDTGVPLPEKQRASAGESMEQLTRRLQQEREQEMHKQRLEYHRRMFRTHRSIAREHAEAYDKLSIAEGGSGG